MVARLQRTTVWLLWAVALLWFTTRAADGQWIAAALGALLLLNLQPIALAFEFFVLLPWFNRHDPLPRAGVVRLLRAWWRESLTAHDVFGWQQPFRADRHADGLHAGTSGRRAVVLLHGFFCNRGVWNRWMPALRAAGVPFVAVTLEPPFGRIEEYVAQIDDAITRATQASGRPPLVVAHSMGGIALRAWWREHAASAAARVHHAITIGSPHQGTVTARLARAENARQMRPASALLRALAEHEADGRARHFTCFFGHCDNIVLPASSAALPGADNRHVEGQPHVALIHAPAVWQEVMTRLDVDPATVTSP